MTTEELLQPRIKIIAPWPQMPDVFKSLHYTLTEHDVNSLCGMTLEDSIETYSANLKLLSWWEGRKVEDMPEYVKVSTNDFLCYGEVYKVKKVLTLSQQFIFKDFSQLCFKDALPATEQEYNEYISKQET